MSAVQLYFEAAGDTGAPALLLGGSLGTTLAMWEPQLELRHARRLIRFDHRGHGRSPVPAGPYSIDELGRDVLALMDGLGLERASYCGLSIGGMVGQWLAINAPDRIERLVLVCTAAVLPPRSNWPRRGRAVCQRGAAR